MIPGCRPQPCLMFHRKQVLLFPGACIEAGSGSRSTQTPDRDVLDRVRKRERAGATFSQIRQVPASSFPCCRVPAGQSRRPPDGLAGEGGSRAGQEPQRFRRRSSLEGSGFASTGRTDCVAEKRLFLPEFTSLSTGIHQPKCLNLFAISDFSNASCSNHGFFFASPSLFP